MGRVLFLLVRIEKGSLKRVFRLPLEKVKCFLLCGRHPIGFNHASRADGALPFLCFAKEKEAKERRLRLQVWLRQTSLTTHPFFGACELAALRASSDKRTLFSEKRMLRSAGRRGKGGSSKRL